MTAQHDHTPLAPQVPLSGGPRGALSSRGAETAARTLTRLAGALRRGGGSRRHAAH